MLSLFQVLVTSKNAGGQNEVHSPKKHVWDILGLLCVKPFERNWQAERKIFVQIGDAISNNNNNFFNEIFYMMDPKILKLSQLCV